MTATDPTVPQQPVVPQTPLGVRDAAVAPMPAMSAPTPTPAPAPVPAPAVGATSSAASAASGAHESSSTAKPASASTPTPASAPALARHAAAARGYASSGPSSEAVAAQARARQAAQHAVSPEGIEAELKARRAALASDLTDLGARLAPDALKAQLSGTAREAAAQARAGFSSAVSSARSRTADASGADTATRYGFVPTGAAAGTTGAGRTGTPSAAGLADRARRLFADARDGDPTSLGIVTGAAVVLAGLSVVALVKAVRR